ncbi:P-loop containing nucleoside triphosphate hydrolase protein [Powellomyces hirtus]|nr:P-loop containing nucleoside triphosphate hydrolase protein [Powellomyces hirtus]
MDTPQPHAENIKVVVRCRPPTLKEICVNKANSADLVTSELETLKAFIASPPPSTVNKQTDPLELSTAFPIHCDSCDATISVCSVRDTTLTTGTGATTREFEFDDVFTPNDGQEDVYRIAVKEIVEAASCGFTGTVFAYGNTGSGKTHTILGNAVALAELALSDGKADGNGQVEVPRDAGILPRICINLFESVAQLDCVVQLSYLEIYNEELFDLLALDSASDTSAGLRIRASNDNTPGGGGGVRVTNLTERNFEDPASLIKSICECAEKRKTAKTLLNAGSSRSHTICMLTVMERCRDEFGAEAFFQRGKLNVVDLAGSENIGKSGATKLNQKEAGTINQSLLALGRVITALNEGNTHIPYRDSKLTRLLQDSIGGSTRTIMIANIGPAATSVSETLNTLTYASGVRRIENKPVVNAEFVKNVLNQKEAQVAFLKSRLAQVKQHMEAAQHKRDSTSERDREETKREMLNLVESHIRAVDGNLDGLEYKIREFDSTLEQSCTAMRAALEEKVTEMRQDMEDRIKEQRDSFTALITTGLDLELQNLRTSGKALLQNARENLRAAAVQPLDQESEQDANDQLMRLFDLDTVDDDVRQTNEQQSQQPQQPPMLFETTPKRSFSSTATKTPRTTKSKTPMRPHKPSDPAGTPQMSRLSNRAAKSPSLSTVRKPQLKRSVSAIPGKTTSSASSTPSKTKSTATPATATKSRLAAATHTLLRRHDSKVAMEKIREMTQPAQASPVKLQPKMDPGKGVSDTENVASGDNEVNIEVDANASTPSAKELSKAPGRPKKDSKTPGKRSGDEIATRLRTPAKRNQITEF